MDIKELTKTSLVNASNYNRSTVNIADLYQSFMMYDNDNRLLVSNVYQQDANILLPDLYWTQVIGRPESLPEPDISRMMLQAIAEKLPTELKEFNERFPKIGTTEAQGDYIRETQTDLYGTTGPFWKNYTRAVIRQELLALKKDQPDEPLAIEQLEQNFALRYDHPLAWMDKLNQRAGSFTESQTLWRFITSLDPDFDAMLTGRAGKNRAQWSDDSKNILPAPELTYFVALGSTLATSLGHDQLYLPHITAAVMPAISRIANELWLMRIDPNLMTTHMSYWMSAWQPEPHAPFSSNDWPLSIQQTNGFQQWDQQALRLPTVGPEVKEQLVKLWQASKKAFNKSPEWASSRCLQWLLRRGQNKGNGKIAEIAGNMSVEGSLENEIYEILKSGNSRALLQKIQFPEHLNNVWSTLSKHENLQTVKYDELDGLIDKSLPPAGKNAMNQIATANSQNSYKISDQDFNQAIQKFTTNLTDLVKAGNTPDIIGREEEIGQIIERMNSRRMRSVIITGKPGTGKSTLSLGYAQKIIAGDVPERQKDSQLLELNIEAMTAGTMYRGDFEKNARNLIEGVIERNKNGKTNIVLTIPEAHTIMGAGSAGGDPTGFEQRIKKWMTDPDLRLIMDLDTTSFNKTLGKDEAFVRRCELIQLKDLSPDQMLDALVKDSNKGKDYYKVDVTLPQVELVQHLVQTHIPQKPPLDTMLAVLDTAMNRANLAGQTTVDSNEILVAVAKKAKLPANHLQKDNRQILLDMEQTLRSEIVGQDEAIDRLKEALLINKSGLGEPDKPIGSFMFIGPTGVGKTETAKVLAKTLTGTEQSLIRIDMSEYMEKHSISKLLGAPPGYVGYDKPGTLTGPVEENPFSVIVIDEIEKAHPDIMNAFLQILDNGKVKDGSGKEIDFTKTLIVMTSNIGAKEAALEANKKSMGFDEQQGTNVIVDRGPIMMKSAREYFRPEFLNRFSDVVPFHSLTLETMQPILDRQIDVLNKRLKQEYGITITLGDGAREKIITAGFDPENGARPLKRQINRLITSKLAARFLLGDEAKPEKDTRYRIDDIGDDFKMTKVAFNNPILKRTVTDWRKNPISNQNQPSPRQQRL
jgi:ATP-dependent Clp protease ATP-binding subunit ClpA